MPIFKVINVFYHNNLSTLKEAWKMDEIKV